MTSTASHTPRTYPCPTCQKPTHWQDNPSRPFCSHRCKLIDLGDWASERYRIAGDDSPMSDENSQS